MTLKIGDLFAPERRGIEPAQYPEQEFELWSVPAFPTGAPERVRGKDVGSNKQRVSPGDVLLCKINPRINRVWVVGEANGIPQIASTEWIVLKSNGVNPHFLAYQLREPSFRERLCAEVSGVGGSLTRARPQTVAALDILIAPVNEQRRIVAKLGELLALSRAARFALDAIPATVPQFVRSLLAAAFDGRLTADVREQSTADAVPEVSEAVLARERIWSTLMHDRLRLRRPERKARGTRAPESAPPDLSNGIREVPRGWTIASVGQLALCLDSFRVPVKRENRGTAGGYAYFGANGRVGDISDYIFDLDMVLVTEDETFYGRAKPIAYRVSGKCWVNNHAHALLPVAPFTPEFLHYALMHYDVEPWLSGTTGRAKLTQFDLLRLPVLVPPAEERDELCRRVRLGLESSQRVREATEELSRRVHSLEEACLAKAFRGDLVRQDSSDEPASELLKRLRLPSPVASAATRPRRVTARA